jgi:hypothetical protein
VFSGEEVHGQPGAKKTQRVGQLDGSNITGPEKVEYLSGVVRKWRIKGEYRISVAEAQVRQPTRVKAPTTNTEIEVQEAV